jgi:hypothetical protein
MEAIMKKLVLLSALALGTAMAPQAMACDYGAHAANATPVVLACSGDNCKGRQPESTAQETAAPTTLTTTEAPTPAPATETN